jgi:hypothetical protein
MAINPGLICFNGDQPWQNPVLNGVPVGPIAADLTASGTDLTAAKSLSENMNTAFNGISKKGKFEVSGDVARTWLLSPQNPNGHMNAEILSPWWNGDDITGRPRDFWITNFGEKTETEAAFFERPFAHVQGRVFTARSTVRSVGERTNWWKLARRAPALLAAYSRFSGSSSLQRCRSIEFLPGAHDR